MQPGMLKSCELLTVCYRSLLLIFVICASSLFDNDA